MAPDAHTDGESLDVPEPPSLDDGIDLPAAPPPTLDDPDIVALSDEERAALEAERAAETEAEAAARRKAEEEEFELGRQRRQNVRVDVQYPIILRLNGREALSRTRDLSATGVGFSTRFPIELDQHGEVTIDFPQWKFTKSFAARFIKPILAGWQVGVQFDDLTEDERERLVKEVFNVQRTQLQSRR